MAARAVRSRRGAGDTAPSRQTRQAAARPRHYVQITDRGALDAWLAKLESAPLVSFDTETDSLDLSAGAHRRPVLRGDARRGSLRAACATTMPAHPSSSISREVLAALKPWLENPARFKARPSPEVRRATSSRITASRSPAIATTRCSSPTCSTASRPPRHGLDGGAVPRHQDHPLRGRRGKGAKQITFNQVDVERADRILRPRMPT